MSLSLYNKKRNFKETSEPVGKEQSSKGSLRFVVQKHDASHVHYDFRLEMEGVLKSWAVPKGPSLNPADKRLAMMVEDHPYDYRNFEGVIPEGSYGGGTVIVWDEGTYQPAGQEGLSRKEQEKTLLEQLHNGHIRFVLHGQKLKGEYALFQMKGRGEKAWILVKKKDDFASKEEITELQESVKTGKTLAQVAKEHGTEVHHPDAGKKKKANEDPSPVEKKNSSKSSIDKVRTAKKKVSEIAKKAASSSGKISQADMPHDVLPMLATLIEEPFNNKGWLFEIKWDGYRAIAYIDKDKVELESRNLKVFTEKYRPIADALKKLKIRAVLDGEIVAVNEKGLADFQRLQNWQNTPVRLQYYVFDVLWADGYDITSLSLIERKAILKSLLPEDHPIVRFSDHVVERGKEFFKVAVEKGLEGIMAKKTESIYQQDTRTDEWVKIKVNLRQEVVVAGYTKPRNSRKFFGSLLLGVYDGNKLIYVGHTGSGFNKKSLETIYNKMQPLVTEKCPFAKEPHTNMPATWIKPKLVCEIKFTEWTKDRMARHPIFMGLRDDKKAKAVTFEKAKNMASLSKKNTVAGKDTAKEVRQNKTSGRSVKRNGGKGKRSFMQLDLSEKDQSIELDGHELKLTNLNKLYWKKENFSKGDMINYYLQVAPYILPYLLNRPQSLNRYPNGISGTSFYQKDVKGKVPDWMETHQDFSESTNETVEYLVCSNAATLIYMANLGCIEMHPWHSRVQAPNNPDWCLIDLDPDKGNSYDQVMETAKVVREVLASAGADCYCKTSGSTGMHIFIPLGAKYNYDQSKELAESVVSIVNRELPELTSMERSPAKRKGKLYLDFLQNRETQTAAAPYSLRPKPGVPVSTPLDWSELKHGLTPGQFNAFTIFDRLNYVGDLFRPVLGKGINLEKVLKNVRTLLNKDEQ